MNSNTMQMWCVADLVHAPWNPRTEAELKPEHPEMVKLIESVQANGIIQPVAVWRDASSDKLLVIAGNRRLAAAEAVGLEEIPGIEFAGISEAQARAITRAENEVRFGVSPLMDAKLVSQLVETGCSQAEVAALLGVSEATVCRRLKLNDLSDMIRRDLPNTNVETRALEVLANLQKDVQERIWQSWQIREQTREKHAVVSLAIVRHVLSYVYSRIRKTDFAFADDEGAKAWAKCMQCGKCTGVQRSLFPEMEYGDEELHCLDDKCLGKRIDEAEKRKREKLVAGSSGGKGSDGVVNLPCNYSWHGPYSKLKFKKKRDSKNTFAYFEGDANNLVLVGWGPDPKALRRKEREKNEKRKAKESAENAIAEARRQLRQGVVDKIAEVICLSDESAKCSPSNFAPLPAKGVAELFDLLAESLSS